MSARPCQPGWLKREMPAMCDSMLEISEDEAFALAGEAECPVLRKEESEGLEAAVCLKRFPAGYVLGASDRVRDLRLWLTDDLALAEGCYEEFVRIMRNCGSPFGPLSEREKG